MHYSLSRARTLGKIIAAAAFLAVLYACSSESVKIEIKEKTYEEDGYSIVMEYPLLYGNSDFIREINSEYSRLSGKILDDFSAEAERSAVPRDTLTIEQKTTFNKNGILSIVGECEAFTGGPHPTLGRIVRNYDIKNSKAITPGDLFTDSGYINRINSYIESLIREHPADFRDLWKKPVMSDEREFYISQNGIVIYFPPYELSYYSKGFVEIEIPIDEIESYMCPEYSSRMR